MRKNARKIISIVCCHCGNEVQKLKKEHDRQVRNGRSRFYCNNSCSALDNKVLQEKANYNKNHPKEAYKKLVTSPNYTGRSEDEYTPFRYTLRKVVARIKTINKKRNFAFNIDEVYIKTLWDRQDGTCPYTGIKMDLPNGKNRNNPRQASLDRIDSKKGYEIGNVEFVCLFINYGKNGFSKEQVTGFLGEINSK